MNFQHLDRKQALTRLQTTETYRGWTKQKLSDHLGNHVREFRKELDRIENKFYYFLSLPDELQAVILSYDKMIFKKSMVLCKSLRASPALTTLYYHQFCHEDLGWYERLRYLRKPTLQQFVIYVPEEHKIEVFRKTNDEFYRYVTQSHHISSNNNMTYYRGYRS